MSSRIVIYEGPGAANFSVAGLEKQLSDLCDTRLYRIEKRASLRDLMGYMHTVKMLVVPGGFAPLMIYDLMESSEITLFQDEFVAARVNYYGVCAGAIAASSGYHSRFNEGIFKAKKTEMLGLVPEIAFAPLGPMVVGGESISFKHIEVLAHSSGLGESMSVVHVQYPGFHLRGDTQNSKVLSRFRRTYEIDWAIASEGKPYLSPAGEYQVYELAQTLLYREKDQGAVLLTASHLELDSYGVVLDSFRSDFSLSKEEQAFLKKELEPDDIKRAEFVKTSLTEMEIACKS